MNRNSENCKGLYFVWLILQEQLQYISTVNPIMIPSLEIKINQGSCPTVPLIHSSCLIHILTPRVTHPSKHIPGRATVRSA